MKKIFFFCAAAFATLFASAQEQVTLNFHSEFADRVMVSYYTGSTTQNIVNLNAGDNLVTITKYSSSFGGINVESLNRQEFSLDSIICQETGKKWTNYSTYIYISGSDYSGGDGYTYNVYTTSLLQDSETDSVNIVIVGNRENVRITREGTTRTELAVPADTFAVSFDSDASESLIFSAREGSLYKVEKNNVECPLTLNYFIVSSLSDGDTIRVTTDAEIRVPVTIQLADDTDANCIDSVLVDGEKATDWNKDGFSVPFGARVEVLFNITDYNIKVNDAEVIVESYLVNKGFATDAAGYVLNVSATPYPVFNIKVTTQNPECIAFYDGNGKEIALTEETVVTIQERTPSVTFEARKNCEIDHVSTTLDGVTTTVQKAEGATNYAITVSAGMLISIEAHAIVRDKQYVLYIDNVDSVGTLEIARKDINSIFASKYTGYEGKIVSGYNVFAFNDDDNPHYISVHANGELFLGLRNDQDCLAGATSLTNSKFELADKDVLKFFACGTPETCAVTFEQGEFTLSDLVRDIFVPVSAEKLSVQQGTRLDFTTDAGYAVANGVVYEAEDGVCQVFVEDKATTITLTNEPPMTAISNAQAAADNNVYTLQGVLLIKNASQAQIDALPAGLYIINGKTSYLLRR